MKAKIHPKLQPVKVHCACGNNFDTLSVKSEIHVEVCHKCHPFYTGEHRFLDVKGRVEKFQRQQKHAQGMKATLVARKMKKTHKTEEKKVKTLKELLIEG